MANTLYGRRGKPKVKNAYLVNFHLNALKQQQKMPNTRYGRRETL